MGRLSSPRLGRAPGPSASRAGRDPWAHLGPQRRDQIPCRHRHPTRLAEGRTCWRTPQPRPRPPTTRRGGRILRATAEFLLPSGPRTSSRSGSTAAGRRRSDAGLRPARAGLPDRRLTPVASTASGAVLLLVRVLPPIRRVPATTLTTTAGSPAPSTPRTSGSRLQPRWASTSSTCRRSTRSAPPTERDEQHPHPRPVRSRLAVGDRQRRRRSRRHPSRTRRLANRSTGSSPRPPSWASRWRWTSRCKPSPTIPGSPSIRTASPRGSTAPSPTPRTRRRSTRTSIRSTSTMTPTASTTSACGRSSCG